jgi:hypothetical protein
MLHTGYEAGALRMSSRSLVDGEKRVGAELVSWCREMYTLRIERKIKLAIHPSLARRALRAI